MTRLLEAAINHARANGATLLKAYPVDPHSPGYRFMGFISIFVAWIGSSSDSFAMVDPRRITRAPTCTGCGQRRIEAEEVGG